MLMLTLLVCGLMKTKMTRIVSRVVLAGFVICIGGSPVLWTSRMQSEIALSMMEAEYISLSTAMRDLLPMIHLLKEVCRGVGLDKTKVATIKSTVWEGSRQQWMFDFG